MRKKNAKNIREKKIGYSMASETKVRNVAVAIFLAITFPTVGIYILEGLFLGISIGLFVAMITFVLFVYLAGEEY